MIGLDLDIVETSTSDRKHVERLLLKLDMFMYCDLINVNVIFLSISKNKYNDKQ